LGEINIENNPLTTYCVDDRIDMNERYEFVPLSFQRFHF
jgi:hypothetical protein